MCLCGHLYLCNYLNEFDFVWQTEGAELLRDSLWLTWPLTLSVERLSLEKAGADGRLGLEQHDDRQRSQAAAVRPRALQVLLSVPLQTLQPQDAHEKVFTWSSTLTWHCCRLEDLIRLMPWNTEWVVFFQVVGSASKTSSKLIKPK